MGDKPAQENLREQLIAEGVKELNRYGFHDFSVRRIANQCGVSCAAPYKHFPDKQSFIAAIIQHINEAWAARQKEVVAQYPSSMREQLLEVSLEYIRFLVENPYFRSVIMLKYEDFDKKYSKLKGALSMPTYILVEKYCKEVGMPEDVKHKKTFIIRSLIYGAALMFDNGELAYTKENMDMIESSISREFDLP
jgi:hypothetical protein